MPTENKQAAPVTAAEELDAVLHWRGKQAQAIKERDALQLRLNAAEQRIDELERCRGQAVMKLEAERLWGGAGEYVVSFVKPGWLDECRRAGGEFLLYTAPPVPVTETMPFEFEHSFSKEKRTVTLTKREVFDGMEDYFYEKLAEQLCQCESVGETNVVDCNCDEYVHDFEIVDACLEAAVAVNTPK